MPPRLQERYQQEILPALSESLGRTNRLSLPRLEKIVINMGVGAAVADKKCLEEAVDAMERISGQKPIVIRARKSVAGFRLRGVKDRSPARQTGFLRHRSPARSAQHSSDPKEVEAAGIEPASPWARESVSWISHRRAGRVLALVVVRQAAWRVDGWRRAA